MASNSMEQGAWWQVRSGAEIIIFFLHIMSEAEVNIALPALKNMVLC